MELAGGEVTDAERDVVEGFGRFAAEVIAPTDAVGDVIGATIDADGTVFVPDEMVKAYRGFVTGGWAAATEASDVGGAGLRRLVGAAIEELFASANLALSLNQLLTQSAVRLLARWGSAEQRERYLPALVTGEWSGTMDLTEPDAGSDVGAVRTLAEPRSDGWRITGTKIFISWGEHQLTSNIIHLVLARTAGSPPGTKGLSLFAVPKVLADGSRNEIRCIGLEDKLGIHASPTCVMAFDRAHGELIGEEREGMRAMFSMMNAARLSIATQGLATGDRCRQQAETFANERRQGRASNGKTESASPISEHPDVRRMLLDLRSSARAMRLLLYTAAARADVARQAPGGDERAAAERHVGLLTPIAKAWCTDTGFRLASLAVQVHGGVGYVEGTGVAQRLRDSRIGPIYEGTNGIQAIDLALRKVAGDGGIAMKEHLSDLECRLDLIRSVPVLSDVVVVLEAGLVACHAATDWILSRADAAEGDVLASATSYLELVATATAGVLLADLARRVSRSDATAIDVIEANTDARFFAHEHVVLAPGLLARIVTGGSRLAALSA